MTSPGEELAAATLIALARFTSHCPAAFRLATLTVRTEAFGASPVTPKAFGSPASSPRTAVPWSVDPGNAAKGSHAVPLGSEAANLRQVLV